MSNSILNLVHIPEFAFPDFENRPTKVPQRGDVLAVPRFRSFKFRLPVVKVGARLVSNRTFGIVMAVPKTTMHKDHFFATRKYQIRSTR